MPTGYTAAIADGITFEQYAMNCARAFGACVTMRDDPSDAPIPEEFAPSDYNARAIEKERAEIARLTAMTPEQAHAESSREYQQALASRKESLARYRELRAKYADMLSRVEAWQAPTPEHAELKKFMADQIRQSIEWDCNEKYAIEPVALSTQAWRAQRIASAEKSLQYHIQQDAAETERAASRTAWVKALRESLKGAA